MLSHVRRLRARMCSRFLIGCFHRLPLTFPKYLILTSLSARHDRSLPAWICAESASSSLDRVLTLRKRGARSSVTSGRGKRVDKCEKVCVGCGQNVVNFSLQSGPFANKLVSGFWAPLLQFPQTFVILGSYSPICHLPLLRRLGKVASPTSQTRSRRSHFGRGSHRLPRSRWSRRMIRLD